jgi:hypothetical protein
VDDEGMSVVEEYWCDDESAVILIARMSLKWSWSIGVMMSRDASESDCEDIAEMEEEF